MADEKGSKPGSSLKVWKIGYEVYCASQRLVANNLSKKRIISLCGIFTSIFLAIIVELVITTW